MQEIFAVQVLPGIRFPELVIEDNEFLKSPYVLPDEALAEVKLAETPLTEAQQAFAMAMQAYQSGNLKEAVKHYRKGLASNPKNMVARYQLGVMLVDLQQWQAGIDELTIVVEERTDHAEAHNSLGVAHLQLGDLVKARWHFERAIALNPRFALPRNNLRVLQQMKQQKLLIPRYWRANCDLP